MDVEAALLSLGDNPLLGGLGGLRAATPAKSPAGEAKTPKKKRAHDPNAPKRPLTPYFLYMQTARPIIAEDLGPDVAKGAVSTEGVKRWNAMAVSDKQVSHPNLIHVLKYKHVLISLYSYGPTPTTTTSDSTMPAYTPTRAVTSLPRT
jgi:hypothetical protein